MKGSQKFQSHSVEETEKWASEWAKNLRGGECIALIGELGSGKTSFVRGLFLGLGGDPSYFVTSPTFTLLHEYPTKRGALYHLDLYRLNTLKEWHYLGFDDYLKPNGFSIIEWGDKFIDLNKYFKYKILFFNQEKNHRMIEVCQIS